jgi:NitT/TauT family transport system permease protein
VLGELGHLATTDVFWRAIATTIRRQLFGYAIAIAIGVAIAIPVSRSRALRSAVGSLITGLQTMPSIAWFPLAIVLFKLTEGAITFVVVLGAAPSIANGIIAGIDHIPPLWLRAGRSLEATGVKLLRHVIIPAAFPSMLAGLKQGWAFAWRSLMAGELIVVIANRPSLGGRLQFARELSDYEGLLALMIVVLLLGILADAVFTAVDHRVRARRGLLVASS